MGKVRVEVEGQGLYGLGGEVWNICVGDCLPAIEKFIKGTCDCCADVIALLGKKKAVRPLYILWSVFYH